VSDSPLILLLLTSDGNITLDEIFFGFTQDRLLEHSTAAKEVLQQSH